MPTHYNYTKVTNKKFISLSQPSCANPLNTYVLCLYFLWLLMATCGCKVCMVRGILYPTELCSPWTTSKEDQNVLATNFCCQDKCPLCILTDSVHRPTTLFPAPLPHSYTWVPATQCTCVNMHPFWPCRESLSLKCHIVG